ncbi:MAG TPA: type II toxin-antitoxin system RelE/ParE family toxin [Devosia sp.]|nr:type II toxin-antitoxin system RelE/ParE family toxin [Devosia sp.]
MKTIIFTPNAARQLDALQKDVQDQILADLGAYATSGEGDVKRLKGRLGYRLRSGRYRVLFNEDQTTVLAIYIGKRETTTYR